mmetsp:Transcript_21246/g.33921  ORF Transcript_21246/g.33921 Transcript_21246/m.33921 type:complete len:192 (-) Transcript_21246:133-708(-)
MFRVCLVLACVAPVSASKVVNADDLDALSTLLLLQTNPSNVPSSRRAPVQMKPLSQTIVKNPNHRARSGNLNKDLWPADRFIRARRSEGGRHRLCVTRTNNHMYAAVVDHSDFSKSCRVLAQASTLSPAIRNNEEVYNTGNVDAGRRLGKLIAEVALAKGIKKVWFDRQGLKYFGRVKAVAEGAREGGLDF